MTTTTQERLALTPSSLQGMALGAVFTPAVVRPNQEPAVVTSLDFHRSGEFCASANAVGDIQMLDAHTGRRTNTIRCAKYGAEILRFTHHQEAVICSSRNSARVCSGHACYALPNAALTSGVSHGCSRPRLGWG